MPHFSNDNLSLFYREQGAGDLLIILPGNTASSACHQGELDCFGQHFHAVSPDFRGTGQSPRLASWPQDWWEKCAGDITALVSHLGRKRCFLMGTSGGANIALLLAIRFPDMVAGVVADSCAELFPPERLRQEVSDRSARTNDQIDFWRLAHGDDWEDVVEADSRLLLDLADQGGDVFQGRLKTVTCPVLFTGSLTDSSIPDIGEQNLRMARQIPGSRVFLEHGGDHPYMWYSMDAFRSVSMAFLRGLT